MSDRITLRFLAVPGDAETDGSTVQAGSVLEWIDKAGYACAVGWAGMACVTAYVGNINFERAIHPGELVEASAQIIHTGRSSIHVRVTIASADTREPHYARGSHCILVFVAVDSEGSPQPVRPWVAQNDEDRELAAGAEARIVARARIHVEMQREHYTDAGTAPRVTFRFLAAPSVVNFGGNAHGGTVMRWIDEAARTVSTGWSKRSSVAVYSGGIHFYRPIHIGQLVEVEARLIHTGERSMHVAIHVRSGDVIDTVMQLTTQCMSILVTKGDDGRAIAVERFIPVSAEDRALDAHALELIAMRAALSASRS